MDNLWVQVKTTYSDMNVVPGSTKYVKYIIFYLEKSWRTFLAFMPWSFIFLIREQSGPLKL